MSKRKTRGGSIAAKVIKVVLLIIAVIIILAAAVFGTFYLTNGFGGNYATFLTKVNDDLFIKNGSVDLPSGSLIKVASFSDYSLKVVALEPDEDFEFTVDGNKTYSYSDISGEEVTAGFTITETDDGIVIEYEDVSQILSLAIGGQVTAPDITDKELFTLVITGGESQLALNFAIAGYELTVDPDHIYF